MKYGRGILRIMSMNQTTVCRLVCLFFVVASLLVFSVSLFTREDFVIKPHEKEEYYRITDEVTADAAIVYNITDDSVVAGKNINELKSIASITKLTAALLAYPRLNDDDLTTLDETDFRVTANTPLQLGDTWRTAQLLEYSIMTSSNRGINAVGRTIEEKTGVSLVTLMNAFARQNALVQTHFINPTGLDTHSTLAGSESSALDLAKLAGIIVATQPDFAALTTQKEKVFYSRHGVRYGAENTNILLGRVPERILLSKTGYTDIAAGTLIMVTEQGGVKLAFVVLGSTRSGRFEDMKKMLLSYSGGIYASPPRSL